MSMDSAIWNSLPMPAVLIDAQDTIQDLNPAAEGFLNASSKAMRGQPIWDKIMIDAPLEEAFRRARDNGTPLFVNDVDVGTGEGPPKTLGLMRNAPSALGSSATSEARRRSLSFISP